MYRIYEHRSKMSFTDRRHQLPFPLLRPSQLRGSIAPHQQDHHYTNRTPYLFAQHNTPITDMMPQALAVMNGNYNQRLSVGATQHGQYGTQGERIARICVLLF